MARAFGVALAATWTGCAVTKEPATECNVCKTAGAPLCKNDLVDAGAAPTTDGGSSCLRTLSFYDGTTPLGEPSNGLSISVRWSPVDAYALSGAEDMLRLLAWNAETDSLTKVAEFDHQQDRIFVGWLPDGQFAVAASLDVRLYAVGRTPPSITQVATYTGHKGSIYSVTISPDGKYAFTTGDDGTARLLAVDGPSATLTLAAMFTAPKTRVYESAWSPDGKSVWLAAQDGAYLLAVDGASTGSPSLREVTVVHRQSWVTALEPAPTGTAVLEGTWLPCNALELWNVANAVVEPREVLVLHSSGLKSITWRPDGASAFSAGHDDTVRFHHVGADRLDTLATLGDYTAGVHSLSLSRDGRRLLVAASHRDRITVTDVSGCQ